MRDLSAHNVLEIWEWSQSQHPVNRALGLLYVACPEFSWQQLATLSIGQRDAYLLALRERIFGETLQMCSKCQHCGETLEFDMSTHAVSAKNQSVEAEYSIEIQNMFIRYRLPNSIDLFSIAQELEDDKAGDVLLQRCLIDVTIRGEPADKEKLPEDVVIALGDHMLECDPQAEILLNIDCPACDQNGHALFDINSYLWSEFVDFARRLIQQVSMLARVYGWSEKDILSMSAWRRQFYQELLIA